jgi:hypothetical protein
VRSCPTFSHGWGSVDYRNSTTTQIDFCRVSSILVSLATFDSRALCPVIILTNAVCLIACVPSAVRATEQSILEKVNVSISLAVMSPVILASVATMITLIVYTSTGHHLTGVEVWLARADFCIYCCIRRSAAEFSCSSNGTMSNLNFALSTVASYRIRAIQDGFN